MAQPKSYNTSGEDGKGTVLLIGVLMVLIVIIGGALLYVIMQKGPGPQPPGSNQTTPPQQNVTNATVEPTCDDACIYQKAVNEKSFTRCGSVQNADLRQQCFGAISDSSFDACKALENAAKRKECIISFARIQKDASLCDLLKNGDAAACMAAVDPCYNVTDKKLCLATAESDPSKCQSDQDCLLSYSLSKKDEKGCAALEDLVVSTACMAAVKNTDKCSDLEEVLRRQYCYQLNAQFSDDPLICTQIVYDNDALPYATDCLSYFAGHRGNLSFCDTNNMLSLDNKWTCYTNYALATGDLTGCSSIHALATTSIYKCASAFAQKFGNPSACNVIVPLGDRSICYQGAIIYFPQNLNWTNCANVISYQWRNSCYIQSAKKYNDVTLCDYIDTTNEKNSCISSYQTNKSQTG